ncbi:glutamyl-tRNA reductase [Granulicoccus sp. GXG6511]|uniref:glutamyl-tRNA reductase n=1 Tax=Granulicoccus sp. GXG6511 TaxID=3381351 RepID=UPI003D7EC3CE
MSILVVSVSHKTAPMDLLARLTLPADVTSKVLSSLLSSEHVDEAVVLSTCNRTELYAAVTRFHGGLQALTETVEQIVGISVETLQDNCAVFYDEAAVSHCFSVTSGLDSMVRGEHQILGQVRQSLNHAQSEGAVGTTLNALFQQALRVAKRVQTETAAGTAGRSLVTASLAELADRGIDVGGLRALVVGAGSMAALAAHTLDDRGAAVTLVNRTLEKADRLADAVGGRARPLEELTDALDHADVVVTCTGARGLRLTADDLRHTPVRGVVDLALPADVADEVGELPGVELVNLDVLARIAHDESGGIADGLGAGAGEIAEAEAVVAEEVKDFLGLRRAAAVAPTVVALRSMAQDVMTAELARLNARLPYLGDKEREEIQTAVRRVVEKLLHQPTVRVKQLAAMPDTPDYAAALRELFALDSAAIEAVSQSR